MYPYYKAVTVGYRQDFIFPVYSLIKKMCRILF